MEEVGLRYPPLMEPTVDARDADRGIRHAAWRYLAHIEGSATALPTPDTWRPDGYERLLLAAVWGRQAGRAHAHAAPLREAVGELPPARTPGMLLAQSMLLGRFDAPGAGLSVLLGGLGDALTGTGPVARVVTLVTAGHEDLAGGGPLIRTQ